MFEIGDRLFHAIKHEHAKHHGYCSTCREERDQLYHCGVCMTGVYCSTVCLISDQHTCDLIGKNLDEMSKNTFDYLMDFFVVPELADPSDQIFRPADECEDTSNVD